MPFPRQGGLGFALFLVFFSAIPGFSGESGSQAQGQGNSDFPPSLIPARCIGPASMGGRITDIAIDPKNSSRWVVGSATGGVWITENSGKSWATPFDSQSTLTIGAVALNPQNTQEIWVGTGESNARNSVSPGNGVYFSPDNGKSWIHKGLTTSRHIGRIVVDPANPSRVFVAALGPLWIEGGERGLFLTEDKGKTWKQVLPIPGDVGAIDVQWDPHQPGHLMACAYRVRRDGFSGGNPSEQFCSDAGLYHSKDNGKSWSKLTRGLPDGLIGRCGIDYDRTVKGRVLAVIQTEQTDLSIAMGQNFTEPGKPVGPVDNGGVFESADSGLSWKKINDLCPRPFYFSQVRTDPNSAKKIWVLGIPLFASQDGGKTFRSDITTNLHPDHHVLVFDKNDPKRALLGNDGGLYASTDRGRTWTHQNNMVLAQFYAIDTDQKSPYRVTGGLQDNGTWTGLSRTGRKEGIAAADWSRLFGADGFQARHDPANPHLAYLEIQDGGLRRHDFRIGISIEIRPRPSDKEPPFRFNWNSPILLSKHQANTIYYGANFLFRSREKGANWQKISPDLTCGTPGANSYAHTLTAIGEDKKDPKILWAGSDDGLLHLTLDDGKTWKEVGKNLPLPGPGWITSITTLPDGPGSAVVTIDRHRNGDGRPYLFATRDSGATWTDHSSSLSSFGSLHAYIKHPTNPLIAFLGTENGLAMTFDSGAHWIRHTQIPNVPVHGLAFAATGDKELAVGTHGRGAWIVDISQVERLATPPKEFALFDITPIKRYPFQKTTGVRIGQDFFGDNPPSGATLWLYQPNDSQAGATIQILDDNQKEVFQMTTPAKAGYHQGFWKVPMRGPVDPGENPPPPKQKTEIRKTYRVLATWQGKTVEKPLEWIDLP